MKYTSALISDARNKLGGDVFARNRAGLYVRVKVKPKNPKTTSQQANRANFSTYTKAWRSLTAAQILGWNTLAGSSSLTDTLGNSFQPTGIQLFISCNRNLSLIGASPISAAPASKPSFPTIFSGAFSLQNDITYGAILEIGATAAAFAIGHTVQASVTKALSTGVSFVGQSSYRNLGRPDAVTSGTLYWNGAYNAVMAPPAIGKLVGIRARIVDPATGYASQPETAIVTVIS